jgi:hypothetical protein
MGVGAFKSLGKTFGREALECGLRNAPKGGYLTPGIGSSVPGQNFTHGWIKHDLYNQLNGLVGKADMAKFLAALKKGVVEQLVRAESRYFLRQSESIRTN